MEKDRTSQDFKKARTPKADVSGVIAKHPAHLRFKPGAGSRMHGALLTWATHAISVGPVELRLTELRVKLAKVEKTKAGITWESDANVLIQSDPLSWALARLISLTESELLRRQGWAISTASDVSALWKMACVLLCDISALANENTASVLSPVAREEKLSAMRNELRQLVGQHADDLVATGGDRKLAFPTRFDG
jgi:hypothetical protein